MSAPVCVPCGAQFRPRENGVAAVECFKNGDEYKLWMADVWKCPKCGAEVLHGFGAAPIAEHYQDDFAAFLARFPRQVRYS